MSKILFRYLFIGLYLFSCQNASIAETEQPSNETTSASSSAPIQTINLTPKELIQYFFSPKTFKSDVSAYYEKDDSPYLVEFGSIEYLYDKTEVLIFFKNYPVDENGEKETYHAAAGFVSTARVKQKGDAWEIISFVSECCGAASWGMAKVPQLIEIGSTYFLYEESGYLGQGHYSGSKSFIEIDHCNVVIAAQEEDNSGAIADPSKTFAYSSEINIYEDKGVIKAKIIYSGTNLIEDKVVDISREELYHYDNNQVEFIKKN